MAEQRQSANFANRALHPRSRREFLRAGVLGLGGLSLSDLLAARACAGNSTANPSLILFWMWGGPSQLETFDPKPQSPIDYRGPFQAIRLPLLESKSANCFRNSPNE
ncbi:MAG: hypothetical protein WCJ09_18340 [Planctomycetota bacterium]